MEKTGLLNFRHMWTKKMWEKWNTIILCGCVSEKAPQSVTIVDLTTAAVDPTARNVIVARAVSNTLQQCVGEFVK